MNATRTKWRRVSRSRPCPICGKPDWCTVTADGGAACCMRVESPKRLCNGGYLHRLCDDDGWRQWERVRRVTLPERPRQPADFRKLAERFAASVDAARLESFARALGVSADALRRLRVGFDGAAWTFPMVDAAGPVCGIRRRLPDGRKLSVPGGHEGLFFPTELPADGLLLVTEGPTDCAALLGLGFACIGRPSCRGGVKLVCALARGQDSAIIADGDEPGRLGGASSGDRARVVLPE